MPPKAFVSYSWDDEDHKSWVRGLAERLRSDGVEATIDQWETVPGDQLPAFMERAIAENEFVLIICTPRYKNRCENRVGGVGYEGDIITAELLHTGNQSKFIPILRKGQWREAAPNWLLGKYYIDLRDGPSSEGGYQDLVSTLLGSRPQPPPVAVKPREPSSEQTVDQELPTADDPIRILGIIVDEVGEPRNDGTRGSALYRVPFRLSRPASGDWAQVFENVWNRPPRYTTMHRPGIATAYGDRIVLDGTTVEEVQKYHRDTLVLCVEETNRRIEEHEDEVRKRRQQREIASEEHKRSVRDVAGNIRFED